MAIKLTNEHLRELAKDQSLIVGRLSRWLEEKQPGQFPRSNYIHPSALSRDDFCERAAYHEMADSPVLRKGAGFSSAILRIMEEGTTTHVKWQNWIWAYGELTGMFGCLRCDHEWWATSPSKCPKCGYGRPYLEYREVPLADEDTLLKGHADLRVGMALGEIKTVGLGSVRIEAPNLYRRYTHFVQDAGANGKELVDISALWNAIKRPFPAHIKQLQLYLYISGLDRGFVIYECKWNQQPKEMFVPYTWSIVEPLLETCYDLKYALTRGTPPRCPHGSSCERCAIYYP